MQSGIAYNVLTAKDTIKPNENPNVKARRANHIKYLESPRNLTNCNALKKRGLKKLFQTYDNNLTSNKILILRIYY